MNITEITNWIKQYAIDNNRDTLIVGISGGIDSSVVSTLCAKTGMKVYVVSMPINQISSQHDLSLAHGNWLTNKFPNVTHRIIDLSGVYKIFNNLMEKEYASEHSFANSKSWDVPIDKTV